MKKYILSFICELEGFKTAIKQLHWDANNLSQHKLCDDIAGIISDYQDKVAEVEQSISGKLPVNNLTGTKYTVTTLKKFVEDVISATNSFYSKLKDEGDDYIGMRSDTEAVLSDLQRQLYLVDFTIKECLKQRLRDKINEDRVTVTNGRETYSLTENELREMVAVAVNNVKTKINESNLDRNSARRELDFYLNSLKEFENKTIKVAGLMLETGYKRAASFLGGLLTQLKNTREYIEVGDIQNEYEQKKKVNEDYYSMQKPYGSRKLSDFSSKDSKGLYDYDPGFAVSHKLGTDEYEPAPLGNIPYNEPEFPEDDQPYQYWNSLKDFDDRKPIEPSKEDKDFQMNRDWNYMDFKNNFSYEDEPNDDYNYNTHDNAFDAAGAKGRVGRLNSFGKDFKGDKARNFNGTMRSLSKK